MNSDSLIKTLKYLLIAGIAVIVIGIVILFFIFENKLTTKERIDVDYGFSYYLVGKKGKYGVKSIDGDKLVPIEMDTVYVKGSDDWMIFCCRKDDYIAIYDLYGNCLVSLEEYYNRCYPEVLLSGQKVIRVYKFYESGRKEGLLSSNGNVIIPCKYSSVKYDEDIGYITAWKDNGVGLFDKYGQTVISCSHGYDQYYSFKCNGANYLLSYNVLDNRLGLFHNGHFLFEHELKSLGYPYIVNINYLLNGDSFNGKGFYIAFEYGGWVYAYDKYGTYIGKLPESKCKMNDFWKYEFLYDPGYGFYYNDENHEIHYLEKDLDNDSKVYDTGHIQTC